MEHMNLEMILFLFGAGFLASFIDSVVGGGGLISLPALLATGLPPNIVLGTNKLASVMGVMTSTLSFFRSGKVSFSAVKYLLPLSFIGAVSGVFVVRHIPPDFLKPMVIVMLIAVAIYSLCKKDWGSKSTFTGLTKKTGLLSGVAAFVLGFYDGFFGPGTGSFLIFAFLMLGFDFVEAAGNAKALNFASNIAAISTFIMLDSVNYQWGFIMGCGMIIGAIFGSRVAIRQGVGYVRPLFISVTGLLIGKQLWDLVR